MNTAIMKNLLYSLLSILPLLSAAQVSDDFSDGDFSKNPSWNGDQAEFSVNAAHQLQLVSTGENNSALSTPALLYESTEWDMWVKLAFSPSDNNNARIYLVSDQPDLEGLLNGYYLKLGESGSADALELYRQSGNMSTIICRGTEGLLASPFAVRIRVTRSAVGLWRLSADAAGGHDFQAEATGTDNYFNTTAWMGVSCKYTSSNSTRFYFDDFYAGPLILDNIPPTVTSLSVVTAASVDVLFSENVESASATDVMNYAASPGPGHPLSATQDLTDKSIVHLAFGQAFENRLPCSLSIDGVSDLAGNRMLTVQLPFLYNLPATLDVLINEMMVDPDPAVGLPLFEYVELFNRSNYPVNLDGWTLIIGTGRKNFGAVTLKARGYLIVAAENARQALSNYGPFAGFSSFSLTNTNADVQLLNADGCMIHNIDYTDAWYDDEYKKEGGWSLELIDPLNPCGDASSWKASVDISGGTPGKQNSVFEVNPDLTRPKILRVTVEDPVTLTVYFTETLDSLVLKDPVAYLIDNEIGEPLAAGPHFPGYKSVTLLLPRPVREGVVYTLSLTRFMKDCAGNLTQTGSTARFAIPSLALPGDIVLNEVLFDPMGNGADFVELYNRSSKVIDLRNLTLANIDTLSGTLFSMQNITEEGFLFFPGNYLVLTTDPENVRSEYLTPNPAGFLKMESLPAMNNESGTIALALKNAEVIDWFAYDASMHFALLKSADGVSLERISASRPTDDRSNWHSAAETAGFATPAYQNSQSSGDLAAGNPLALSPEIFSPDNDGNNDILNIVYSFGTPGYMANITVFDATGRLVRNLVNNELCAVSGVFSWDGFTNDRRKAGIGYYIIYTEIFDLKGNVRHYKNTTVLGGKL
jgi:hypothetical protein